MLRARVHVRDRDRDSWGTVLRMRVRWTHGNGNEKASLIARNVTGLPASRQARIFMKIELNSIKNRLSTGPRVGRARFRLLLAGNGPRVWSKT